MKYTLISVLLLSSLNLFANEYKDLKVSSIPEDTVFTILSDLTIYPSERESKVCSNKVIECYLFIGEDFISNRTRTLKAGSHFDVIKAYMYYPRVLFRFEKYNNSIGFYCMPAPLSNRDDIIKSLTIGEFTRCMTTDSVAKITYPNTDEF